MGLIKNATFWFNLIEIHATRATPLGRNVSDVKDADDGSVEEIKLPSGSGSSVRKGRRGWHAAGGGTVGVAVAVACSNSNKYCQNTCQMAKQWSWDVVRARCTLLFQKKGDINWYYTSKSYVLKSIFIRIYCACQYPRLIPHITRKNSKS